jgi:hypothetical protein
VVQPRLEAVDRLGVHRHRPPLGGHADGQPTGGQCLHLPAERGVSASRSSTIADAESLEELPHAVADLDLPAPRPNRLGANVDHYQLRGRAVGQRPIDPPLPVPDRPGLEKQTVGAGLSLEDPGIGGSTGHADLTHDRVQEVHAVRSVGLDRHRRVDQPLLLIRQRLDFIHLICVFAVLSVTSYS